MKTSGTLKIIYFKKFIVYTCKKGKLPCTNNRTFGIKPMLFKEI